MKNKKKAAMKEATNQVPTGNVNFDTITTMAPNGSTVTVHIPEGVKVTEKEIQDMLNNIPEFCTTPNNDEAHSQCCNCEGQYETQESDVEKYGIDKPLFDKTLDAVKESMRRGNCPIYYINNHIVEQTTPYDIMYKDLEVIREKAVAELNDPNNTTHIEYSILNKLQVTSVENIIWRASQQIIQTILSYVESSLKGFIYSAKDNDNIVICREDEFLAVLSSKMVPFNYTVHNTVQDFVFRYMQEETLAKREKRDINYGILDIHMKALSESIMVDFSNIYTESVNQYVYDPIIQEKYSRKYNPLYEYQYTVCGCNRMDSEDPNLPSMMVSEFMAKGAEINYTLFVLIYGNLAAVGTSLIQSNLQTKPFNESMYGPNRTMIGSAPTPLEEEEGIFF